MFPVKCLFAYLSGGPLSVAISQYRKQLGITELKQSGKNTSVEPFFSLVCYNTFSIDVKV